MDDLENEIQNYKEMSTSINRIKSRDTEIENEYVREPFSDHNLNKKNNSNTSQCSLNKTNFNVDTFVKDLENNLDNFDNIQTTNSPLPSNLNFNSEKPKKKKIEPMEDTKIEVKERTWKEFMYSFLIEIKEPVIIIILFILVNNPDFIKVVAKIPYLNRIPTMYPSLIIRGSILAIIIYYLRKYSSNDEY